jgi:hypothetical protein
MELSAEEATFKSMVAHEVLALRGGSSLSLDDVDDSNDPRLGEIDAAVATSGAVSGRMAFATQDGYAMRLLRTARLLLAVRKAAVALPLRSANVPPLEDLRSLAMLPSSPENRQRYVHDTIQRYSVVGSWKALVPFLLTRDLSDVDPAARNELALTQAALRCRAVHGRISAALCEGAVEGIPGSVALDSIKTRHLDESIAYAEEAMSANGWLARYSEYCADSIASDDDDDVITAVPTWSLTKSIVATARSVSLVRSALKRGDFETARRLLAQADGDNAKPVIAAYELKLIRRHIEYSLVTDELRHALSSKTPMKDGVSVLQHLDDAIRRGMNAAAENVEPLRPLLRHATHLRKLRAALSAANDAEAMLTSETSAVSDMEVAAWRDVESVLQEIAVSGLMSTALTTRGHNVTTECPPELRHMVKEVAVAQQRLQRHHVIAELRGTLAAVEHAIGGIDGGGSVAYKSDGSAMVSYTQLRAALSATRALHSVLDEDVLPSSAEQKMVARAVEILAASDTALRLIDKAMASPCVAIATIEASLIRAEQIGLAESAMCARGREAIATAEDAITRLRDAIDRVVTDDILSSLARCRNLRIGLVAVANEGNDSAAALTKLDAEATELVERAQEILALPESELVRYQLHAALRMQDEERIVDITLAIKAQFFDRVGHSAFSMSQFAGLKTPVQFTARLQTSNQLAAGGSSMTTWSDVRKKLVALREGMLEWSEIPIHASLCHLHRGVPRSAAGRCHVLLLQLMGDAPIPQGGGGTPSILLAKLLRIASDHRGTIGGNSGASKTAGEASRSSDATIRSLPLQSAATTDVVSADAVGMNDELYAQIMKQLTRCPSVASLERGWATFRICLHYIRPSDTFENYVESFLRTQQPPPSRRGHHQDSAAEKTKDEMSTSVAMLRLFHRILYIGTQPLPSAHELERALWRFGGIQ